MVLNNVKNVTKSHQGSFRKFEVLISILYFPISVQILWDSVTDKNIYHVL